MELKRSLAQKVAKSAKSLVFSFSMFLHMFWPFGLLCSVPGTSWRRPGGLLESSWGGPEGPGEAPEASWTCLGALEISWRRLGRSGVARGALLEASWSALGSLLDRSWRPPRPKQIAFERLLAGPSGISR